jgi:hypothetical protein
MALIIAGHPLVFSSMAAFIQAEHPRRSITIIKGNHDVHLHWQAVQDTMRRAVDAWDECYDCLRFVERYISEDGVYVEHGHQYTERINRWPDFDEPHDPNDPEQLYLTPGARFVYEALNDLEWRRYWVNGVKPLTALLRYALIFDFPLALKGLLTLMRHAPPLIWAHLPFGRDTLEELEAQRELLAELEVAEEQARKHPDEPIHQELIERIEQVMPLYSMDLEDDTEREYTLRRGGMEIGWAEECSQRSALVQEARKKVEEEDVEVVVLGHTHAACSEYLGNGAVYINTGTWTWTRNFAGDNLFAWRRFLRNPDEYTAERMLTYVRIDYDQEGHPLARLQTVEHPEERRTLWEEITDWFRETFQQPQ